MRIGVFIILFVWFFNKPIHAQLTKVDSLKIELKNSITDSSRYNILYKICSQYFKTSANNSQSLFFDLIKTAHKLNDPKKIAKGFDMGGQLYTVINKLDSALFYLDSAMLYANSGKYLNEKAAILDSYGAVYEIKGEYDSALKKHLEAINYHEKVNDKAAISDSYKYIGRIFAIQNKLKQGLDYFKKALALDVETKNQYSQGQSLNNIAICNFKLKNYDTALYYFNESVRVKTNTNNKRGLISSYSFMIDLFLEINDVKSAILYSGKLTALAQELNSNMALAAAFSQAGEIYTKIKRPFIAKNNFLNSLHYYNLSQKKEGIMATSKKLSHAYKSIGNNDSAFYYLELYDVIKDSLFNDNNTRSISEMEAKYQNEKKEHEISLLQKNKLISDSELSRQKAFKNFILIVAILILLLGVVLYRAYINKRSINDKLTLKNSEVEKQKEIIEVKQKDIKDSINYALRIQEALFPDKEIKAKLFNDAFVLLKQKDIVSGDFYWYTQKNGKTFISAVDCTGHGVPGAFMSMIGLTFLNEIVNEKNITTPALILSELSNRVIKALKQKGSDGESRDGMDMAIVAFNEDFTSLEYAGANNPLWIFRKEEGEIKLIETKPDKRPIGYFRGMDMPFTNNEIKIYKGDCIYIFTDGYADQFGGEKGKKFKYKKIKEVLLSIIDLPMLEQEEILLRTFDAWKGNLEQVDDVCIIGIRL
jgi:serine phosphatase RsbU (regulator of sigma subunit)